MAKDSKNWESPLEKALKQQQELARRIIDGLLLGHFKDLQEKINKPYKDIQATIRKINQPYKDIQVVLSGGLGNAAMVQLELAGSSHTQDLIARSAALGKMISKQSSLQVLAGFPKGPNIALSQWDRSFADSFPRLFSTSAIVNLQQLGRQQLFDTLNTTGSLKSVAASIGNIVSLNRSFADSFPRLFSTSAIVELQSLVSRQPLNTLKATELLRPVIKLSQSTISADLFVGSVIKSLSMSSLTMPTVHLRIPTAIESPQSIFKSYQPIFAKQEKWKESLFSAVQRPTTQTERIFYKALTNDTDLESDFVSLKSNEYRKDLFTPESPSRQPQLLVPQAVESSDDACFDPVFWYILTKVEQYLRSTIEKCLTELSGSRWIRQRVPCNMRKCWEQRQEEERSAGRPVYSLIQYADFMNLASIIIQANNWRDVFESIFKNKNEIQISLQRLHPIRKSIAHSRPLTNIDILTLANEASRIFRALGLSFSLELSVIRFRLH